MNFDFKEEIIEGNTFISYYCKCGLYHQIPVKGNKLNWQYNGDIKNVTLSPSVLTRYHYGQEQTEYICHHFVRNGQIEYLSE